MNFSIFKYIETISKSSLPVLITGETGVGKELIAESIHKASPLKGSFTPVNVAGIDDHLFSDMLFGHVKGAYTGADEIRSGLIEKAAGGTLFLDEIGDLKIESQVKLLRLLQNKKYYPLGSDSEKTSNCRIIVATNQNIVELMDSQKFRKDLFYRLQTHHIHIPPLRERLEDIPLLTDHFLENATQELDIKAIHSTPELIALLKIYHFPGNIRELEGMIFNAVSVHESGKISLEPFRKIIIKKTDGSSITPFLTLEEAEKQHIENALKKSNGNQSLAAQLLGISRKALNNRLRRASEK